MARENHLREVFNSPYYKRLQDFVGYHRNNPWFNQKVYGRNHNDYSRPFGFPTKKIWQQTMPSGAWIGDKQ